MLPLMLRSRLRVLPLRLRGRLPLILPQRLRMLRLSVHRRLRLMTAMGHPQTQHRWKHVTPARTPSRPRCRGGRTRAQQTAILSPSSAASTAANAPASSSPPIAPEPLITYSRFSLPANDIYQRIAARRVNSASRHAIGEAHGLSVDQRDLHRQVIHRHVRSRASASRLRSDHNGCRRPADRNRQPVRFFGKGIRCRNRQDQIRDQK